MTYEFKKIIEAFLAAKKNKVKTILATVVALDGSSYRRPGVRMLIDQNGKRIGAVSGGCVEKEIFIQAGSVFETGIPKVFTYDGRYRLGCEGVLYILVEPINLGDDCVKMFYDFLANRESFVLTSFFCKKEKECLELGSWIEFGDTLYSISKGKKNNKIDTSKKLSVFSQKMEPCFKLVIFGTEHDAVQLSQFASLTGWEVSIVSVTSDIKTIDNFPGANMLHNASVEGIDKITIDKQTAIVFMTHNFANDLKYLLAIKDKEPAYIGLLGPAKRRDDLLSKFMEYCSENVNYNFLDKIYGPAGINIGAETPQEIAISIISEILSLIRQQEPILLSKKLGRIHD